MQDVNLGCLKTPGLYPTRSGGERKLVKRLVTTTDHFAFTKLLERDILGGETTLVILAIVTIDLLCSCCKLIHFVSWTESLLMSKNEIRWDMCQQFSVVREG